MTTRNSTERSPSSPARAAASAASWPSASPNSAPMSRSTTSTGTAPAKYGEVARSRRGGQGDRGASASARYAVTGNIGDQAAVAEDEGARSRPSSAPSTFWSIAPAATSAPRAASRSPTTSSTSPRGHPGADQQQPDRHDAGVPGLRAADGAARRRLGRQHRARRPPISAARPRSIYSTLKAAVVHYTRCLAKELIDDGVRVNAVSPGPTKTARFQATRMVDPAKMDSSKKSLNRYAEPDEIADAVAFLAGPRAQVHQRAGAARRRRFHDLSGLNGRPCARHLAIGQRRRNVLDEVQDSRCRLARWTRPVCGSQTGIHQPSTDTWATLGAEVRPPGTRHTVSQLQSPKSRLACSLKLVGLSCVDLSAAGNAAGEKDPLGWPLFGQGRGHLCREEETREKAQGASTRR